ncbi:type III-B CRISPR-associated protein Cas10/Cmr2 [Saprospira grandis]|uniref:type III-B CRISPR-associated protein Cas10/Cmr2 n=1 Tax=Saprospira grandis TaxID=1008 RepID=UPI0022DCF26F|nr:type III-B CRISPR-associated protein Cas10/Cmr2 [Saprospira grandis]WBM74769.1 type III-B CRISPR-associated protein Cas10/Cmr2 [Saprospira grandis]
MITTKHLFIFTIGPVQSFISKARKTQDLYVGSRMLSDLIGQAMEKLKSLEPKVEFVFPNKEVESKPNRFVAELSRASTIDWQSHFEELQKHIFDYLKKDVTGGISFPASWFAQIEDYFTCYYSSLQYTDDKEFIAALGDLERQLAERKNIRDFAFFEEQGRKCMIDGEYNVKIYRKNDKEEKASDDEKLRKNKYLFDDDITILGANEQRCVNYRALKKGEGLSAISFLKRLYAQKKGMALFPSIAEIALRPTIESVINDEAKLKAIELALLDCKYKLGIPLKKEHLNQGRKDYDAWDLYYEDNWTKKHFEENDLDLSALDKGNLVIEKRDELLKLIKGDKDNPRKLAKYYAVVFFDADDMGKKLQAAESKEDYQRLSNRLANFAQKARKITDENAWGRTVYAGGDDFVGFFNLNYVFSQLKRLRVEFDRIVNRGEGMGEKETKEYQLTFSAGLAVGHYKTPLGIVLNAARGMEHRAKAVEGKNAIAIAVLKRSGEIHETVWPWSFENDGQEYWPIEFLDELTSIYKAEELSKRFNQKLAEQFRSLVGTNGKLKNELQDVLKRNLQKRWERQLNVKEETTEDRLSNWKVLYKLHEETHEKTYGGFQNFMSFIDIAEFISRELNRK